MIDKELERFNRLPLWARREISKLKARVERAEAEADAATAAAKGEIQAAGASVWLNPYDKVPTPVTTRGEYVRFALSANGTLDCWDFIDIRATHERDLEIHAGRGITFAPRASNTGIIALSAR